jgi:hypothetical protein
MSLATTATKSQNDPVLLKVLEILDAHHKSFHDAKPFAEETGQLVPSDTKSWSQILICILTGIKGRSRQKGSDLADGSDVKAANTWCAIDTPRFNGCIPAGRLSKVSKKAADVSALDDEPFLFFVLWDERPVDNKGRCRVWCVRPPTDKAFRKMAGEWYRQCGTGDIKSTNFQLHPPRHRDDNIFNNTCGNLSYPLMLSAHREGSKYVIDSYKPEVMKDGECKAV